MKNVFFVSALLMLSVVLHAQKTAIIHNLTDAWGISYTYCGEIVNGKPGGMGVATYSNGVVRRYVGGFENGFYSGKGVMLFENGSFSAGSWSKGKMSGKCGYTTAEGAFFAGELKDGMRNGMGQVIYKDNSFVKGNYVNDKLSGRCINVWKDGNIVSDIFYANDLRNGTGFQYEVNTNKLYEGEWKDDKWVETKSAGFYSFLNVSNFKGEKTADHILIGPLTAEGYLRDTAYFYDLNKRKRYFGYYEKGFIKDGLQVKDDSTRFVGATDNVGAKGYCFDFKFNKFYTQGYYVNDKINGDILDIDLVKKTVYIGAAANGAFTGKAYFFNDKGSMYYGDYVNGTLNGQGFRLENDGHLTIALWKNGTPVNVESVLSPDGEVFAGNPKTFEESLNAVVKDYPKFFDNIIGFATTDYDYDEWMGAEVGKDSYYDYFLTLINFAGSTRPNIIADDLDLTNLYIVTMIHGADQAKAKAKYEEVVKKVAATSIANKSLPKAVRFKGTITAPDMMKRINSTKFQLDTDKADFTTMGVWVKLRKDKDGTYAVSLEIGEQAEE